MLDIVYFAGKSQQAIGEAQSLYKHAKSNHNKSGMAVSTYVLGNIYLERARYAEAEDYLIQCVHFLDNNKDMEYLLVACYERLSDTYLDMEQYDKAMEILQKLENYHNEHTMSRFSFSAKYNLYCNYTKLYIAKGDWNNADTYCSLAENIGISDDSGDFAMSTWMYCRAMILAERKQYKDALNLTEKALQIAYNTYQTEVQMTDGLLELKAKMLKRLGRGNEVFAIYDTILKHTSERANDRFHAQLDELRTQYEVDKHIAEKEHNKSYFLFALAGVAFLVIIVVIIFISRQKMHKKNVALARQILELTKRKGVVCNDPALETDKLFLALENYMQRETPFTEPSFNRETIAYKLNTNEEYLRKTIKKNTNLTISDYILHYRLRFSQDLLLRPTNQYTIEAIAFDSGFGSRSTFYRVFSQKYGLTPSEFRKIAVEKTDE